MDEVELANTFDSQRLQLRAVAYRILGSMSEADDAVQEAWLRLQATDAEQIDSLQRWLTTVVAPHLPEHAPVPPDTRRAAARWLPPGADHR